MDKPLPLLFFVFIFCLLGFPKSLVAQSISGTVRNGTGQPIVAAFVGLTGASTHTHSDENGNFSLSTDREVDVESLVVSALGYQLQGFEQNGDRVTITMTAAPLALEQVTVGAGRNQTSNLTQIDLALQPVNNSQEILRRVPGLFIGQHAGGGKAEQIFLRGFDIDHGTDIAISVDGMPVNLVSHAHGQGYADLHFIIPETIDRIDFGKGPYYADQGNFSTAGYVEFATKDRLENSSFRAEAGQFNTLRLVTLLNLLSSDRENAYLAASYLSTDGPFESSQRFGRTNLFAKYHAALPGGHDLRLTASHFSSSWDASGQIPERAVARGDIGRFGAIDDTEGGNTSRTNAQLHYTHRVNSSTFLKSNLNYSHYDFRLFSNFTFFLEDPEFGDQIAQEESRDLLTAKTELFHSTRLLNQASELRAAVGLREDRTQNSSLANTINRTTLQNYVQLGDITERNLYAYGEASIDFGNFTLNPGIRLDQVTFGYEDQLDAPYAPRSRSETFFSPKINFLYSPTPQQEYYFKTGIGFHSNDSRLVLQPGLRGLTGALGADLGANFKVGKHLFLNAALWALRLEQEFVYVGDAGIVEPAGRTSRRGVDLSARYQVTPSLYFTADATYSHARLLDAEEGADRLPLAPAFTLAGGLFLSNDKWQGNLSVRWLGDRPADETNSVIARGYCVADLNLARQFGRVQIGTIVQNLFDVDWNETQFLTESRRQNEVEPVEEIHFTPGSPFNLRAFVRYAF